MARSTKNRRVTTGDSGAQREEMTNAPAVESENARTALIGPFKQHLVTANQAGVVLNNGLSTGDLPFVVAPRAGQIVGTMWGLSTAGTHTSGKVQATINGTVAGDLVPFDGGGTTGTPDQSNLITAPITFNEGDKIGFKITTDANWLPVTADISVSAIVRYSADGVPRTAISANAP